VASAVTADNASKVHGPPVSMNLVKYVVALPWPNSSSNASNRSSWTPAAVIGILLRRYLYDLEIGQITPERTGVLGELGCW